MKTNALIGQKRYFFVAVYEGKNGTNQTEKSIDYTTNTYFFLAEK